MPAPTARTPYEHTLYLINTTNDSINGIATHPDGRPRDLDATMSSGVLTACSNLAIASALLAVADALRAPRTTTEA